MNNHNTWFYQRLWEKFKAALLARIPTGVPVAQLPEEVKVCFIIFVCICLHFL